MMERLFGAASVVLQALYRTIVAQKEMTCKANYLAVYVPNLTYGHELWSEE